MTDCDCFSSLQMLSLKQMAEMSQDTSSDPKVMGGSIKRRIVNPDLVKERTECSFDRERVYKLIFPIEKWETFGIYHALVKKAS